MKILLLLNFIAPPFLLFSQHNGVPKEMSIEKTAFATLKLPGSPDFLAPDGDDVWILNVDRVEKLSAGNNKPVVSFPIPGACGAMIVGFKSLWVASCSNQAIYRIDNTTGKLLSVIPCGISDKDGEIMLAIGDSSLWVLSNSTGVLTRISARTNEIETSIAVLPNSHCAVFDFNSVWITNTVANSVQRIDPKTNKVVATIKVGKTPRFLAAGENGVWTLNPGRWNSKPH
jgi:virginiamycin B lyase